MKLTQTAKILLISANIWYFGEGMMGPLFAEFAEKVGGDILDITWAWATYLIMAGVMHIVIGRLINNKKFKVHVLVAGYFLNAIFTFGYLLVDSPAKLFLVQAGLGFAEALGGPTWDALFAKNQTAEVDTYAWGLSSGQTQIVTGIAFAAGGVITHFISFEALFITMGLIQILAACVSARLLMTPDLI